MKIAPISLPAAAGIPFQPLKSRRFTSPSVEKILPVAVEKANKLRINPEIVRSLFFNSPGYDSFAPINGAVFALKAALLNERGIGANRETTRMYI